MACARYLVVFLIVRVGITRAQPNVLITYYSASSFQWTAKLGSAIAASARAHGANVTLSRVNETSCADLTAADAIALGTPTYWAGISAQAKSFIDNIQTNCGFWPPTPNRTLQNKIGAAFATGGHEADGKDAAMATVLAAWRAMEMVTVSCANGQQRLTRCNAFGAQATHPQGSVTPANASLSPEERGGAEALGARLVEVARLMMG